MTKDEIESVVRDYFEGWYDGDVDRIGRALHPDLAKRRAEERLQTTTRERMLELAAAGEGRADGADRTLEIEVDEVRGEIASARVRSAVYDEFVHLVRTGEGWKVANTIWRLR
ncbi:MAG TPA: nuclear transport factor 2 family protein [Gaiellaceae bacterium]|nr:nuclear transport factor 2 family protein [Gaiellaceae bacterium]